LKRHKKDEKERMFYLESADLGFKGKKAPPAKRLGHTKMKMKRGRGLPIRVSARGGEREGERREREGEGGERETES
jgi:hypothetical protein